MGCSFLRASSAAAAWHLLHHGFLHGVQGHNLLHHGLLHQLYRNLCFGTWSTSSFSFFTELGVCRAASLAFFSLLSLQRFLPLLKFFIPEVPPASLLGFGQQ